MNRYSEKQLFTGKKINTSQQTSLNPNKHQKRFKTAA
jgi:hypothetical protein